MTADELEVRRILAAQVDGWNRGDAHAFAGPAHAEIAFTNILGMRWDTRSGFEARHDEMFRGPFAGSQLAIEVERLWFALADTAIVELLTVLTRVRGMPPGVQSNTDGSLHTRMLEVLVKSNGRWEIVACHNTAVSRDARL